MVGEVVTPRYRQTTVLSMEGVDRQGKRSRRCRPRQRQEKGTCTTQMNAGDEEEWDTSPEGVSKT